MCYETVICGTKPAVLITTLFNVFDGRVKWLCKQLLGFPLTFARP